MHYPQCFSGFYVSLVIIKYLPSEFNPGFEFISYMVMDSIFLIFQHSSFNRIAFCILHFVISLAAIDKNPVVDMELSQIDIWTL